VALLRQVLPQIEAHCPGLMQYWDALEFVEVQPDQAYHTGPGTHLPDWVEVTWLVFQVQDTEGRIPAQYRAQGHTCRLGVDADGTALIIPKGACQSLFFDRQVAVSRDGADGIVDIRADAGAAVSAKEKVFDLTLEQFVQNFNAVAAGSSLHARVETRGDSTARISMGGSCGAVLTLQDGQVAGVLFVGASDGSVGSGAELLLGLIYSVAGVRPDWPKSRRLEVLQGLAGTGGLPEEADITRDGVKFSLRTGEALPLLVTIVPAP
jgi:hypothetical protein